MLFRTLTIKSYKLLQSDVSTGSGKKPQMWQRLLLVSYDSVFPGGWGKRFIFEEQVPGEAPEDARLLLDCKLSPVKGKRERERERMGGWGGISTLLTT